MSVEELSVQPGDDRCEECGVKLTAAEAPAVASPAHQRSVRSTLPKMSPDWLPR
jgi:hypothetical protein